MKAGIYCNPLNGHLAYVAKDRSVRAGKHDAGFFETTPAHRKEFRVRTFNDGAKIELEDGTAFLRVADVPNGCTDPQKALADYQTTCADSMPVTLIDNYGGDPGTRCNLDKFSGVEMIPGENPYKGVATKIYDDAKQGGDYPRATSMPATLGMGYGKDLERETEKPRISGRAAQILLQEGQSEAMVETMIASLTARGAVHVLHDEYMTPSGTSHGTMSGKGPDVSNLDRTDEKMARLAAGSKSGVPEAWRNVENAHQYKDLQFEMERVAMQAQGFRLCHSQSARKHRKQGDTVAPSSYKPGAYYWRQSDDAAIRLGRSTHMVIKTPIRRSMTVNTHIG